MYLKFGDTEINVERREGAPLFYFERYIRYLGQRGKIDETEIGLPLVHIEVSRKRHDHNNEEAGRPAQTVDPTG